MVAIASLKKDVIFAAVRGMYTEVARHPEREYHFPTGRAACAFVGYPDDRLARLPASAIESFAGVGYPFAANVIRPGDTVLDVGSGSGTDLLLAARETGERGHVIGLDMTAAMVAKLAEQCGRRQRDSVRVLEGNAEQHSAARRLGGCRHEQRRPQSRARQARGVRRNPPRAQAGRTDPDRRHRARPPALRRVRLGPAALGRVHRRRDARGRLPRDDRTGRIRAASRCSGSSTISPRAPAPTRARSPNRSTPARSCSARPSRRAPPLPTPLPWPPPGAVAPVARDGSRIAERPRHRPRIRCSTCCGQTCGTIEPMMKLRHARARKRPGARGARRRSRRAPGRARVVPADRPRAPRHDRGRRPAHALLPAQTLISRPIRSGTSSPLARRSHGRRKPRPGRVSSSSELGKM